MHHSIFSKDTKKGFLIDVIPLSSLASCSTTSIYPAQLILPSFARDALPHSTTSLWFPAPETHWAPDGNWAQAPAQQSVILSGLDTSPLKGVLQIAILAPHNPKAVKHLEYQLSDTIYL